MPAKGGFHQKVNDSGISLEGCITEATEVVGHDLLINAVQVPPWNWEGSCLTQS